MQINGISAYGAPSHVAGAKMRAQAAIDRAAQFVLADQAAVAEPATQPPMMARGQPPADPNLVLENWGSSNPFADLNTDGIVDAQDLALALNTAQESPGGGGEDAPDAWTALTGGDLNNDGSIDAMDLAIKLNEQTPSGGGEDSPDEWTALTGGDLNNDGVVDAMDLALKLNAQSPAGGGESANNDGSSSREGIAPANALLESGSIEIVLEDRKPEAVINRLSKLILQTLDQDGDQALTAADLNGNEKLVARFDLNSSGAIEQDELVKGLREEFRQYRSANDGGGPAPFVKRWLETFSGMRPMPDYSAPMRLQELFAPQGRAGSPTSSGILSAKA